MDDAAVACQPGGWSCQCVNASAAASNLCRAGQADRSPSLLALVTDAGHLYLKATDPAASNASVADGARKAAVAPAASGGWGAGGAPAPLVPRPGRKLLAGRHLLGQHEIMDPYNFPYTAAGFLSIGGPAGRGGGCSGALIGPRAVLTAGGPAVPPC